MSRWPSGCMWFCLLYVEVLFCCMRRSAVSLGCSEPGWERWTEGTAPTHRLYPKRGIVTFFLEHDLCLKSHSLLFHPAVPSYPSEKCFKYDMSIHDELQSSQRCCTQAAPHLYWVEVQSALRKSSIPSMKIIQLHHEDKSAPSSPHATLTCVDTNSPTNQQSSS